MRILLINHSEITLPGGVHKTVFELAKNLSEMGHNITVLQGNQENLPEEEMCNEFKIIRVKTKFADYLYGLSPKIYFYLKKNINYLNPDIVHIHGYHTLFSIEIMYLIKKMIPETPIVFSPHFGILSHDTTAGKYLWKFYNELIGKKIISYPDKIITASNYELYNLRDVLKVPEKKVSVIPHGINKIHFKKSKSKSNTIKLLYVGYLLELKGVQFIIKSLHELVNTCVNVKLKIIGEGPYKHELQKIADRLDVNEFIEWNDFIPAKNNKKLLKCYKNADILLLLSKSENYGTVVPEALAMGTPVIVTKNAALTEFLNEPGCFGVNDPLDTKEIADLIMKIYRENTSVGPFSRKIRTWNKVTEEYEKIYSCLKREVKNADK